MNKQNWPCKMSLYFLKSLCILAFCCLLVGCDFRLSGVNSSTDGQCQGNCSVGTGANGLHVIVEPDAGPSPILTAIRGAQKAVWLEIYLLTSKNAINALEEDANRGIDVRVILEPHPFGAGSVAPSVTLDKLKAAGVKAQFSNPQFALTHEKVMLIDSNTVYIMTTNFSNAALGTGKYTKNREYDIIDTNPPDIRGILAIFQADWDHSTANFNDPNLVVSPVNARNDFTTLIDNTKQELLIEAEEMNDSAIEQALVGAEQRGVKVQVILPMSNGSSDSNTAGIATIKQGRVAIREDPRLYMHAKIIVADGKEAFVGSENISAQSLDQNRELGILISDVRVLSTLQQTFQTDWGVSREV
jgi:cardiolipin synthase A/B